MKALVIVKVKNGFAFYEQEIKESPLLEEISFSGELGSTDYSDRSLTGCLRDWAEAPTVQDFAAMCETTSPVLDGGMVQKNEVE